MSGLSLGRGASRWLALIWIAVLFLLVRIATHGDFTWAQLAYSYDLDAVQLAFVVVAAAGTLVLAWRALRTREGRVDDWSVGWSVVMVIVGSALRLLGHDSATIIILLAVLGGLLAHLSSGAS